LRRRKDAFNSSKNSAREAKASFPCKEGQKRRGAQYQSNVQDKNEFLLHLRGRKVPDKYGKGRKTKSPSKCISKEGKKERRSLTTNGKNRRYFESPPRLVPKRRGEKKVGYYRLKPQRIQKGTHGKGDPPSKGEDR